MYFGWVLLIAVPPALVALAVWLDQRSGRGYGLALLAAVVLVLDMWGIIAVSQVEHQVSASHTDTLGLAYVEGVYLLTGLYCALVLVLGGIAEALFARQRRWLAIIAIGGIVPIAIIIAPWTALVRYVRGSEALVFLLVPVLITFVYALVRIYRPVAP